MQVFKSTYFYKKRNTHELVEMTHFSVRCEEFRRWAGKDKTPAPHSSASPALSAPAPLRKPCGDPARQELYTRTSQTICGWYLPRVIKLGRSDQPRTRGSPMEERVSQSKVTGYIQTRVVKHWVRCRRQRWWYPKDSEEVLKFDCDRCCAHVLLCVAVCATIPPLPARPGQRVACSF